MHLFASRCVCVWLGMYRHIHVCVCVCVCVCSLGSGAVYSGHIPSEADSGGAGPVPDSPRQSPCGSHAQSHLWPPAKHNTQHQAAAA